jgi:hypothetical protein
MKISYQRYDFTLELEKDVRFGFPPMFLFRSMLGKELKYLSCVLKNQKCPSCPLRSKCAYGFIFETPVDKDNGFQKGMSNTTPPYIFYAENYDRVIRLTVTLVGTGNEYFPYFFLAVQRAGETGILRDRIKYRVVSVTCAGKEILLADGSLGEMPDAETFSVSGSGLTEAELNISFYTPLRLKKDGRYTDKISLQDVMASAVRRLNMLSHFYGSKELLEDGCMIFEVIEENRDLKWVEYKHYSARQHRNMNLGGVEGSLRAKVKMNGEARSVLLGGELFNLGKSISFGLGKNSVNIN